MFGKFSQSQIRSVALGTPVNSSTYGSTIPVIYGRTASNLLVTWQANIRQQGSKIKQKVKKSGPQYAMNIDFLIGHNPILTPLQFWVNQGQKLPLLFKKTSSLTSISPNYPFNRGVTTYQINDPDFYAILAVTITKSTGPGNDGIPFEIDDFGNPTGPYLVSNLTWETPVWNSAFHGPDPTVPASFKRFFSYLWTPSMGNTFMTFPQFGISNVYYAAVDPGGAALYGKKQSGTDIPVTALHLTFEPILGDGPEYVGVDQTSGVDLSTQQIFYPCYAGLGSPNFQSAVTGLPEVKAEILGMYGVNPEGDCDFADIIEDIFRQGISQPGFATSEDPSDIQTINTHQIQRGLNCYGWPGFIQANWVGSVEAFPETVIYPQPNTAGNFLVVLANGGYSGYTPSGISDYNTNTWVPQSPSGANGQVWLATAKSFPAGNGVTLTGVNNNYAVTILELGGVDTFDNSVSALGSGGGPITLSITTTNSPGTPALIIAFINYSSPSLQSGTNVNIPLWNVIQGSDLPNANGAFLVFYRIVYQPGTYSITSPSAGLTGEWPNQICMLAFKNSQAVAYPQPLTNILDEETLRYTRAQCRAYGLQGSLVMDSQQKAADWLKDLYDAANAAPVWSGFVLKSIPYAEASAFGNGSSYIAPQGPAFYPGGGSPGYTIPAGPTAVLKLADFISDNSNYLYQVERKAQVDVPNIKQVQIPNRDGDYNDTVISQPLTGSVALFGSRKDSPQQFRCVQDPAVARRLLNIAVNKANNLRNTYSFKLVAKWKLLEPMDIVVLPADPITGQSAVNVRLTSVKEDDKFNLDCEAEPYIYGTYTPQELTTMSVAPNTPVLGNTSGGVNPPIIFEAVPRLTGQNNQGQIWCVVSSTTGQITGAGVIGPGSGYFPGDVLTVVETGASGGQVTVLTTGAGGTVETVSISAPGKNYKVSIGSFAMGLPTTGGSGSGCTIGIDQVSANYTGSAVFLSTDGGTSYHQVGSTSGQGVMGVSTGDWPIANDPDTTNDLPLDLSESGSTLASYQVADEDNFTYPCYIEHGNSSIPYELMTYAVATLTSPFNYTLKATGGHRLRRAVFGTPVPVVGVDHPSGSKWAFLGRLDSDSGGLVAGTPGIIALNMDPTWIGRTLYFKFCPVSATSGAVQPLADAVAYPFTPTGIPSGTQNPNNYYVNTPAVALSRLTTTISMAQVSTQFPSNKVNYNARTFTIGSTTPGTTYYVTIADPGQIGDEGATTNLTATCQTSNALVGMPGNTYMGFVQVQPSGFTSDIYGPGSWPAPFTVLVG